MKQLSRRGFFKTAAVSAAVFNIVPAKVLGQDAPSKKIVMAAIGVGGQGSGNMRAFMGLPDVLGRACCDVNTRKMENFKKTVDERYGNNDCLMIKDFREVCERKDIDAVMIGTPDHWHSVIGCYAASRGKDIYGEKPFTHNLREGRMLVNAIHRNGRVFQAGSWQRSTDNFRRAVELVRNGRIGKITRIEIGLPVGGRGPAARPGIAVPAELDWDMWLGPAPAREYQGVCDFHWRWVLDWGGGQMLDWICHHADIVLWAVKKDHIGPDEIEGHGLFEASGIYDSPTKYRYVCRYGDGLEIVVADQSQLEMGMGTRWFGEDGKWVWVTRGAQKTSDPKIWDMRPEAGEFRLPNNSGHFADFIKSVKERTLATAPAETSHRITSMGHLGQIAMITGRKIRWD